MNTTGVVVGVALLIETFVVVLAWTSTAVPRRFLKWGRNDPARTASLVVVAHGAWLALALVVALLYRERPPAESREHLVGLALSLLLAVLGPFTQVWFARWPGDFRSDREELVAAGASPETAKAFYWSGAVFAYLAVVTTVLALITWFPASPAEPDDKPGFAYCGPDDEVTVTGVAPPCGVVMRVVRAVVRDARVARGEIVHLRADGYECTVDGGVGICLTDTTQIAFDVPSH